MNSYQNIIISTNHNVVVSANYSNNLVMENDFSKIKAYIHSKLPCKNNEVFTITTNGIYVVNKYLKKIAESVEKNNTIICRITIDHKIYNSIVKGTYKYWVANGKTESTNKPVDELELREWKNFINLYSKVFSNVTFSSMNLILQKEPKYNVRNIQFSQQVLSLLNNKIAEYNLDEIEKILN